MTRWGSNHISTFTAHIKPDSDPPGRTMNDLAGLQGKIQVAATAACSSNQRIWQLSMLELKRRERSLAFVTIYIKHDQP